MININTSFEEGHWWIRNKRTNERRRCEPLNRKNARRMYVSGKYIPQTHPLWKSGRYKSFNDAAFSSLENYNKTTTGSVYIINNTAWPEWIKVGKAIDAEDRLKSYQTSDPHRAYRLCYHTEVENRHTAEVEAHKALELISDDRRNEWFKVVVSKAISCIEHEISKETQVYEN